MKKAAAFVFCFFVALSCSSRAQLQNYNYPSYRQPPKQARKAAKQQRRANNKYSKQQQKAIKNSVKAQKKAMKRARRRSLR